MNNKRNKRGPVRTQRNKSVTADGVYSNPQFMFIAAAQVGAIVRIKTKNEEVWEGIFKTFSSGFDVVLEVATLIGKTDIPNTSGQASSLAEKLVFPGSEIVSLSIKDVDPSYATKDALFQTDAAISARLNGAGKEERELEPWDGELNGAAGDTPLELDGTANGWDANEMFKKNETEYGVTSSFDHSLRGYTVQLQHSDTPDYKEAEAKANQIANEIEAQPSRKARLELENGDEEAIYAAVVRPSESNGKYIPPAKRKNQPPAKMARNSPPPPQNSPPAPAQSTASKGAQTSPVTAYAPVQNAAPPQNAPTPQTHNMAVQQQQQAPNQQPPQRYGNRQGGGPKGGQHMNGEANKVPRTLRNVYQTGPPPSVQQHPAGAYQEMQQPKLAEINHSGHNNRHHRDEVKDLQQFAQDFQMAPKEAPPQGPPPQPQIAEQVIPPSAAPTPQSNPKQQPEVPQPQPSPSPQPEGASGVDKVAATLKKSTLNPNAKEFVSNSTLRTILPRLVSPKQQQPPPPPQQHATPPYVDVVVANGGHQQQRTGDNHPNAVYGFNSRTPSTSSLSRPHTPQTPSHTQYISTGMNGPPMGQPPASMILPMGYMMPGQAAQYPPQSQPNRLRKMPAGQMRGECLPTMNSMQVAAATGQPLLAPAPLGQFLYQPGGINPSPYHQMHVGRMYDQQIQYLPQQPSQAGGQPQYAQNQHGQVPPQQYQVAPPPQAAGVQHQAFVYNVLPPSSHMIQGMQCMPQVPPPQHSIPLILQHQQHPVHQGPA